MTKAVIRAICEICIQSFVIQSVSEESLSVTFGLTQK